MYIEPNTNIKILHNVPLDTSYEHTIYFSNEESQIKYFSSLTKYNLNKYTYQRVKRNMMRVEIKSELLYDCNYIMFQNASFGDKWFYAYIKSVEYVNNECSNIEFELDVMQTWFFDYQLTECFVEREHSETDNIGDNIVDENVTFGELVFNDYGTLSKSFKHMVIMVAVLDKDSTILGDLYDNIFGAADLRVFRSDTEGVKALNTFLEQYQQKFDNILSIYMLPLQCVGQFTNGDRVTNNDGIEFISMKEISTDDTLDGYKPKNNKLYTFPYNRVSLDNGCGDSITFRYEFFHNLIPTFKVLTMITQPVTISLRPVYYKKTGDKILNTEQLTLTNFPICSWGVDSYQAYIAKTQTENINTLIKGVMNGVAQGVSGNIVGGLATGLGSVSDILTKPHLLSLQSDISKGGVGTNNINVANNMCDFYGGRLSLNSQDAKIIDDFFTKYGYASRRLKKPNTHSRPHFNYVKTIGCEIKGSIPCDDAKRICSIYDAGITFWKNGNEVGNYSLNNKPN